jgi:hypothetical protein|nr:MAG TPA: hypothetical protein [Caudoviricetes sp.]
MKINFKQFEARASFEGEKQVFDITRTLGNEMMFNGSILLDIGFEDLAREIYCSESEVEVPEQYFGAIIAVIRASNFMACVKREVINLLTKEVHK